MPPVSDQPPIQEQPRLPVINTQALLSSPLFWGIVVGVAGTLLVQHQYKQRKAGAQRTIRNVHPIED